MRQVGEAVADGAAERLRLLWVLSMPRVDSARAIVNGMEDADSSIDHPHPPVVEVFADVWCPFAHVGLRDVVGARGGAAGPRLRVRAWPLELVNGEALDASVIAAEVADIREQLGSDLFTGFDPERFPSSTLVVLGTAEAAYRQGVDTGEAFSLAIRDALFEEGRAVDDPAVLADVAGRFGVDVPSAERARSAVEAELAEGRRRGVTGSPHFFVAGESFFCPALDIAHDGDHLRISVDRDGLERFRRRIFG